MNGQAVVQAERCISCGHCVKVCSQNAKYISSDLGLVESYLKTTKTFAIVAPSFAASFPNDYKKIPDAIRKLGFNRVSETAFGADLIAHSYRTYFDNSLNGIFITSSCPAIYNYIEKYFENLVPMLVPIVSPMIAMGKYLKTNFGNDIKVVFIGPCIAKKSEYKDPETGGMVDAVITFDELKTLFKNHNIVLSDYNESRFDSPHANTGKSFPLAGGLLKTIGIKEDILAKERIVVEGKEQVEQIIRDIYEGRIKNKFIDILFCEGCISGPAIDSELNYYSRREKVIDYFEESIALVDQNVWKSEIFNSRDINFRRKFEYKKQRKPMPSEEQIKEILGRTNKFTKEDELNCGACGYSTCREYAISIAKGIAEEDMCLPYLLSKIETAYKELEATQEQLHNAEKLASIGQLAAGVAHEINNPLGTIIMYSSLLKKSFAKAKEFSAEDDLNLILSEADRCKNIVSKLLNFAHQGVLKISSFDIVKLMKEILIKNLRDKIENVHLNLEQLNSTTLIDGDYDQIKEVFINIYDNAIESMEEKQDKELRVVISNNDNFYEIEISDNGCGISKENIKKIFTPFFSTKKIGKGTGLGLAITYGIVKAHGGDILVESLEKIGTKVKVKLPIKHTYINN
ncbi:MAG: hypothetical protein Fur0015_05790 [Ignavibacteriales bacterium]